MCNIKEKKDSIETTKQEDADSPIDNNRDHTHNLQQLLKFSTVFAQKKQ